MRLIYYGCAGFDQISRSFSFNSSHYSPQTIEKSASNRPNLVTITHLGPPPGLRQKLREKNLEKGLLYGANIHTQNGNMRVNHY